MKTGFISEITHEKDIYLARDMTFLYKYIKTKYSNLEWICILDDDSDFVDLP